MGGRSPGSAQRATLFTLLVATAVAATVTMIADRPPPLSAWLGAGRRPVGPTRRPALSAAGTMRRGRSALGAAGRGPPGGPLNVEDGLWSQEGLGLPLLGLPPWPGAGRVAGGVPRAQLVRGVLEDMVAKQWQRTFDLRPVKTMVQRHRGAAPAAGEQREELRQAADDLLELISPSVPEFSAWDVCQTIDVLVELSAWDPVFRQRLTGQGKGLMDAVLAQLTRPEVLSKLTGRQCGRLVSALGKMGVRSEDTIRALLLHMLRQPLSGQDVSRTLWGLVKANNPSPELLDMLAYHVVQTKAVADLNARSIANIAWAFARLEVRNEELMGALAAHTLDANLLPTFEPQEVANTAWAYAKLGVPHRPLLLGLAERAKAPGFLDTFDAQETSNTAWAFAKQGVYDAELMGAMATHIMDPQFLATLSAQDLATIAWAYAKLGIRNRALMSAIAVQTMQEGSLTSLNAQDLATTAWAYATLGIHSGALMSALSNRTLQPGFLPTFNAQGVATTAWSYAKLGILDEPLMAALADRALEPGFLATFNGQNVANMAWAYTTLGVRDTPLLAALEAAKR